VANGNSECVFEKFFAGEDLFAGYVSGELRQPRVGQGVGTDLMASGEPLANLGGIHERRRYFSIGHIPDVLLADSSRDDELNGAKLILAQGLQSVLDGIAETIIEGNHYMFRLCDDDALNRCVVEAY